MISSRNRTPSWPTGCEATVLAGLVRMRHGLAHRISEVSGVGNSSIVAMLDRLQRRGLVTSTKNPFGQGRVWKPTRSGRLIGGVANRLLVGKGARPARSK